jgi:hypothetical protein
MEIFLKNDGNLDCAPVESSAGIVAVQPAQIIEQKKHQYYLPASNPYFGLVEVF